MFLYMRDNVLQRAGKCCATVRGMFTFSSVFAEAMVQKAFFRKIASDGIEVEIQTNGVYYE